MVREWDGADRRHSERRTIERRTPSRRHTDLSLIIGLLTRNIYDLQQLHESIAGMLQQPSFNAEIRQQLRDTYAHALKSEAQIMKQLETLTQCFDRDRLTHE
jgi:hypothetical protein